MKLNKNIFQFVAAALLLTTNEAFASQQNTKHATTLPVITSQTTLFAIGQGKSRLSYGLVEIEEAEPENRYHLSVSLKNDTLEDVKFDSVRTSSNDASVSVSEGTVVAGGTFDLELDFLAPKSTQSGSYMFSITMFQSGSRTLRLNFRCKLLGNLHLPRSQQYLVRNELKEFFIPISFTMPILASELMVSKSKSLGDELMADVVEKNGNYFINIIINPLEMTIGEVLVGSVSVKHPTTGRQAKTEILVKKTGDLTASPTQLFFHAGLDEDDGFQVASAILEINESKLQRGEPKISCSAKGINEDNFEFSVKKITRNIFRLRFRCKNEEAGKAAKSVVIKVQARGQDTMSTELKCLF